MYSVDKQKLIDAVRMYYHDPNVAQVVRCKDCRWFVAYEKPAEDFDGYCGERNCDTDEGEFCSYGERKEK